MQIEHSFADVVVVRAGMDCHRRLNRVVGHQISIYDSFGQIVAFPRPIVHMNPCFYPRFGLRAEGLVQKFRVLVGVRPLHVSFQNRGIPNGMKIGSVGVIVFARVAAKVADRDAVAAFIVVRRGMQWHVQTADEMDDVADGVRALLWVCLRIFWDNEFFSAISATVWWPLHTHAKTGEATNSAASSERQASLNQMERTLIESSLLWIEVK